MNTYVVLSLFIVVVSSSPYPRSAFEDMELAFKKLDRMAHLSDQYHLAESPNLALQTNMTDMRVKAGDSLELFCNTVSTPASNIFWTLNGRIIQGTKRRSVMERIVNHDNMMISTGIGHSRFYVPCVDNSYSGRLTCFASNGFTTEKKTITLTVEGSATCPRTSLPAPRVTMWTDARYENIGNAVILMCRRNVPAAETVWYNEDKMPINDAPGFVVLPNGDLYIPLLKWEMMGNYYCSVRNSEGEDRVEAFLYPTDPSAPTSTYEEEAEESFSP